MKRKVLIITAEYPPNVGGAGIVAQDTLKKLINNNFEVTLVTNYSRRNKESDFNLIEVRTIPKIRFIGLWLKIRKLNLEEYDSIILNDIGAAMVGAYFFKESLLKKTQIFLHGSEPEKIYSNPNRIFKILKFKKMYTELLSNCKIIIAVSEYMKSKFINRTALNYLEKKIKVIYSGVDDKIFYNDPINLKRELNLDSDSKLLLTVSRIVKEKGYEEKYKIFKQICKGSKWHWIIIGEGEYKNHLIKNIKSDNLENRIHFLGRIDRLELRKYYSSVDVFWLLSQYDESLGLVYLECEFCGVPVIGRNNAGVKEVIINGKTGYLVENNKEVIELLKSDKYLKNINKDEIYKLINKFSFKESEKKIINLQ